MRHTRPNFLATAAGLVLMLFALVNSLVTLTTQDYRGALLIAMICTLLALGCLAVPLVRGPLGWRIVAAILASPALFVFADFARRAPYAFGEGASARARKVEPDTRPAFALDASKSFVIELGRGSGQEGLDIVKVDQTGAVQMYRVAGGQSASLQLSSADVAALVSLVNTNQLTRMGRAYSDPRVLDGNSGFSGLSSRRRRSPSTSITHSRARSPHMRTASMGCFRRPALTR